MSLTGMGEPTQITNTGTTGVLLPTEAKDVYVAGIERQVMFVDTATGEYRAVSESIDSSVENTIINDGIPFEEGIVFGAKDLEFATKKAGLYFYVPRIGS